MSEEENKSNESLKNELLEKQIHDVVSEFESLKNLNLQYIKNNERLNNEIKDLKELNEQQVILNDSMLDNNKEIFKGSKRNIFWMITILSLVAVLLSFKLIDKRINDKITGKAQEAITNINVNLEKSTNSLALTQKLQQQVQQQNQKNSIDFKTMKKNQDEELKAAQKEYQEILSKFNTTTIGTNNAIKLIQDDYATALNNFKTLLKKKENDIEKLEKKFIEELTKISKLNKKTIITNKTIQKAISQKKTTHKTVYTLLQKAFEYQKKLQYSNAIKTYQEVLKINPKKDIAYYNLGIIYGNQKQYTLAIEAYKKSLKLNPKRNLTFTNIFEIQLITNKNFDSHILKIYKDYHKDKKISLIKYEMLDIFKDVKMHKNIDKKLHDWKKNYAETSLGNWSFAMLKKWIKEEKDKTTKDNLNLVLKTFEAHK